MLLFLLSPVIAAAALVVLITAIVSLARKTPTWLRFRGPGSAAAAVAVSAVVLVVASMVASLGASAQSDPVAADPAPRFAAVPSAEPEPSRTSAQPEPPAPTPTATPAPTVTPTPEPRAGTALALLDTLEVKGRAPKIGYSRDQFGQRWKDVDRNGCDTRNDTLARDLTDVVRSGPCTVMSGSLVDPYTGDEIAFVRGQGTSELVQIDHVVALSDAWQKGAQQLTPDERERFANDPLNLLAVDGTANLRKGDGDAASWLPPAKGFRCAYVARQVSVKAAYGLWVTRAEHDAIARILASCPDEPALVDARAVPEPAPSTPPAAPAPAPSEPAPAPAPEVHYANCTEARAAGVAPIRQGEPGYSTRLDRDRDGIACDT